MATDFLTAAQQIIFTALSGIGATVTDSPAFTPEGEPAYQFPSIVIGQDTMRDWSTGDTQGANITVTLHFWSRAAGLAQVKGLMGAAYARLNRAALAKAGYSVTDCLMEFSSVTSESDGVTRHGVQRYRLTIQEA